MEIASSKLVPFEEAQGGFNFDLYRRNEMLTSKLGMKMPTTRKTGTTICGVVYNGGVVLGADTRATEDTIVCDKNCEKIHYIAPNIHCCGAGTSADTEAVTGLISSELSLLRRNTGTPSRVVCAMTMLKRHLFKYQGHVSAALVLGGVDITGPHLYTIYPHGSTDKLPYVTMGSGSLAAMAVFESGYQEDMNEAAAIKLVRDAISAGVYNDLGSGSNVDVKIIRMDGSVEYHRNHEQGVQAEELRKLIKRPSHRVFPAGTTVVVSEKRTKTGSSGGVSESKMELE